MEVLDGYDWREAFEFGGDVERVPPGSTISNEAVKREDVVEVLAVDEGENDEAAWIVVGKLADARWFALEAWCDYTGWDCQAGGRAYVAATQDEIVRFGLDNDQRKRLNLNLPG